MKALSAEPSKAGARCNGYPLPQESKAGNLTPPLQIHPEKRLDMLLCVWYSCSTFKGTGMERGLFPLSRLCRRISIREFEVSGIVPHIRYFLPERGDGKFPSP